MLLRLGSIRNASRAPRRIRSRARGGRRDPARSCRIAVALLTRDTPAFRLQAPTASFFVFERSCLCLNQAAMFASSLRKLPASVGTSLRRVPVASLQSQSSSLVARRLSTSTSAEQETIAKWGIRFGWDNTFLSYHRNAMIATVAGGALIQQQKSESRTPLAGAGLLLMGGLYMYVGSGYYLYQITRLATPLKLGAPSAAFAAFNACWPTLLWTVSVLCVLDETPSWLLELLRRVESHLPNVMRASLFLDPPALYPVCRLLEGVIAAEEERLRIVKRHAAGHWSLTQPARAPLTPMDVAAIIARRLQRLNTLKHALDELATSDRAVPTAIGGPLLSTLLTEVQQLEKVLEADTAPQTDGHTFLWWWLATMISREHRQLRNELDALRRLDKRSTLSRTRIELTRDPGSCLAPWRFVLCRADALRRLPFGSILAACRA